MARGYSLHIITQDGSVIAGFTVKHECESWLRACAKDDIYDLHVTRIRDGRYTVDPITGTAKEFLAKEGEFK